MSSGSILLSTVFSEHQTTISADIDLAIMYVIARIFKKILQQNATSTQRVILIVFYIRAFVIKSTCS